MPIGYPGNSITKTARAKAGGGFESAIEAPPPAAGQRTITATGGQDFGAGPNVVHFNRFTGTGGDPISLTADIGSITQFYPGTGRTYTYYEYAGRTWFPVRPPENIDSTSLLMQQALVEYPPCRAVRFGRRCCVPVGTKFVGSQTPGVLPTTSSWKPHWSGNEVTFNLPGADIVIGTQSGNGNAVVGGNQVIPKEIGNKTVQGQSFKPDGEHFLTYYQSGDESSEGADDAIIDLISTNADGTARLNTVGDTYNPNGAEKVITELDYKVTLIGGYIGNGSPYNNVLPLEADTYVAQEVTPGDGRARACVFAGNAATLTACTQLYLIPPDTWSDSEITYTPASHEALTYTHLILANGTLIENAGGV